MNDDAIYIDDVDMREYGFKVLHDHEHPVLGPTKDNITSIAGKKETFYYGATTGPLNFAFTFDVNSTDIADQQLKLRRLKDILLDGFGNPKEVKLVFGYEPDKFYKVVYSGSASVLRQNPKKGRAIIPLTAYDNNAYSVSENKDVTWGSEDIFFTNTTYVYGHTGSGEMSFTEPGNTSVFVAGDAVRPVIRIEGTASDFMLSFNNKTLRLGSFVNTMWVIDLEEYVVLRGPDRVSSLESISGDWMEMYLLNGQNEITLSGRPGTTFNIEISFEFNDRFN